MPRPGPPTDETTISQDSHDNQGHIPRLPVLSFGNPPGPQVPPIASGFSSTCLLPMRGVRNDVRIQHPNNMMLLPPPYWGSSMSLSLPMPWFDVLVSSCGFYHVHCVAITFFSSKIARLRDVVACADVGVA